MRQIKKRLISPLLNKQEKKIHNSKRSLSAIFKYILIFDVDIEFFSNYKAQKPSFFQIILHNLNFLLEH